jgi:hypothetical protein
MDPGLMPGSRLNKEDVKYRPHESCKLCGHFYTGGRCDLVNGNISPDAICDKWEISTNSKYRDRDFFMNEAKKAGIINANPV